MHLIGDDKISVLIKRDLNDKSSMLDVMNKCDLVGQFHICDSDDCKFLIKKQSGSYLTMTYDQFYDMTVDEFVCISNIHEVKV